MACVDVDHAYVQSAQQYVVKILVHALRRSSTLSVNQVLTVDSGTYRNFNARYIFKALWTAKVMKHAMVIAKWCLKCV